MSVGPYTSSRCHVLKEDPELADPIPPERRAKAIADCTAPALWIQPGPLGTGAALGYRGGIGVLVLDGLMIRRVGIEGRFGAELIGEGDLLRPTEGMLPLLPLTTDWTVVSPTRVAALDDGFEQRIALYPELTRRSSGGRSSARRTWRSTSRSSTRRASTFAFRC